MPASSVDSSPAAAPAPEAPPAFVTSVADRPALTPSEERYPREFRPDIQAMRCLAVLLVVFWHAGIVGFHGGFLGVDVFFVVSGFVITNVLLEEHAEEGRASIIRFYGRRIRRILPAATAVLIATIFFTYHYLSFITGFENASDSIRVAYFWGNFHFSQLSQGYFTQGQIPSVTVLQYWSLAVEEQFYFVWPWLFVALACGTRVFTAKRLLPCVACGSAFVDPSSQFCGTCGTSRRARYDRFAPARLTGFLAITVVLSFLWSWYQTTQNATAAFYSPFTRAWELALGALLAVVGPWLRGRASIVGLLLQVAGTAGILVSTWYFTTTSSLTSWPGYLALAPVGATAVAIAGGSLRGAERIGRFAKWTPIQWIGNVSFSLYLVHFPVIIIAEQYAAPNPIPWYNRLSLVGLSFLISAVLYYVVENPIRRWRWLRRPTAPSLIVTYAMGVLLVCSSIAVALWHEHNEGTYALGQPNTAALVTSLP